MAWMLWVLNNLDVSAIVISSLKAGGGALAACVLRKVWSKVMPETKKCKIEKCRGIVTAPYSRGLCMKCYKSAKTMVETGITSWEILAEKGLCEGTNNDPFNDAYSRAMEDN